MLLQFAVGNYVQFYGTTENQNPYLTVFVEYGDTVEEPEAPTRTTAGYTFTGWYLDGELYVFDTPVTSYLRIDGGWTDSVYTVTFDLNDGSADSTWETMSLKYGDTVPNPTTTPTREGYTLTGWFTDTECTNQWQANATVSEDLTLYAGWKAETYTVTFHSGTYEGAYGTETDFAPRTVEYGECVGYPGEPTRDGYVFMGWFSDSNYEHWFDCDNTPITGDITLYAKWASASGLATFMGSDKNGTYVRITLTYTDDDENTSYVAPDLEEDELTLTIMQNGEVLYYGITATAITSEADWYSSDPAGWDTEKYAYFYFDYSSKTLSGVIKYQLVSDKYEFVQSNAA